jgi:ribosomal protein S18 acetylase RimI-like enzyme
MTLRRTTADDLALVRELWDEFDRERPAPAFLAETWEQDGVDARVRAGEVILAEEDGAALGFAEFKRGTDAALWLQTIYVRPAARRRGIAKALLQELAAEARERGMSHLALEVLTDNGDARAVYDRLGFSEFSRSLAVPVDELAARLAAPAAPSHGAVFVQSDDAEAVERAVGGFVPRLGRSEWTDVSGPVNGWTRVENDLCNADPALLRRLARELSDRTGAVVLQLGVEQGAVVRYILFERGRIADEYASVPTYYGPLPPGAVVALSANPTVAARLTGADPARVRAVARTAASPAELPPPEEIHGQLLAALGVV